MCVCIWKSLNYKTLKPMKLLKELLRLFSDAVDDDGYFKDYNKQKKEKREERAQDC